jgi:hypothetical protein
MYDCEHVISVLEKAKPAVEEGRHPEPEAWRHLFVKALCRLAVSQSKIGAILPNRPLCSALTSHEVQAPVKQQRLRVISEEPSALAYLRSLCDFRPISPTIDRPMWFDIQQRYGMRSVI